jgi:hypothetical protein
MADQEQEDIQRWMTKRKVALVVSTCEPHMLMPGDQPVSGELDSLVLSGPLPDSLNGVDRPDEVPLVSTRRSTAPPGETQRSSETRHRLQPLWPAGNEW